VSGANKFRVRDTLDGGDALIFQPFKRFLALLATIPDPG